MKQLFLFIIVVVLFWGWQPARANSAQEDIFLVLDNSGSMKTNDPNFLTREVVRNFLKGVDKQTRLGMVIFDQAAVLAHPLTPVSGDSAGEDFLKSLEKVDYKGQWTNIPVAIERALYELKTNGRKDAEKIIIFLTDGIVDTGNSDLDLEKTRWLREELTEDSKKSGVRIFAIAFTEKADFSLIQSLALKTEGQYFRAFKAEDIQEVFAKINEALKTLRTRGPLGPKDQPGLSPVSLKPEPAAPVEPVRKEGLPVTLILVILGGIIVLLAVSLLLVRKRKEYGPTGKLLVDVVLPPAKLVDEQQVISSEPIEIHKPYITIGRDPLTDLTIPKETVSALHATITYKNHTFYLEDRRSSNFTRLNNQKMAPNQPVALKSGDRITFDIYHFQFLLAQMTPAGGTVLKREMSQETEGPLLRKPGINHEPPEQKTLAKPKREPGPPPAVPKDKTMVKPGFCPHHPDRRAVSLCSVCKKPFCSSCISEIDGNDVCVNCAGGKKQVNDGSKT